MDTDKDGKFTKKDLEAKIIKMFCSQYQSTKESTDPHLFKFSSEEQSASLIGNSMIECLDIMEDQKMNKFKQELKDKLSQSTSFDEIEKYLQKARTIFGKYDLKKSGFL